MLEDRGARLSRKNEIETDKFEALKEGSVNCYSVFFPKALTRWTPNEGLLRNSEAEILANSKII